MKEQKTGGAMPEDKDKAEAESLAAYKNHTALPLNAEEFFGQLFKEYDVVFLADDHSLQAFNTIGTGLQSMKNHGCEAMFIEHPKDKQERIDSAIKDAQPPRSDGVIASMGGSFFASNIPYYAQQSGMPLPGMDVSSDQGNPSGLGSGSVDDKIRQLKEGTERLVKEGVPREEAEAQILQQMRDNIAKRMDANEVWVENILTYAKEHGIKKFAVVGGSAHFQGANGISVRQLLEKETDLRTVQVTVDGTGNLLARPALISPEHLRFDAPIYNTDYYVYANVKQQHNTIADPASR